MKTHRWASSQEEAPVQSHSFTNEQKKSRGKSSRPHIFFCQLSHLGKPGQVKSLQNRNITIAKYTFRRFFRDLLSKMTVSERKTSKSLLDPTKTYFILEFFAISTILSLFKKIWLLENSILWKCSNWRRNKETNRLSICCHLDLEGKCNSRCYQRSTNKCNEGNAKKMYIGKLNSRKDLRRVVI